MNLAAIIGQHAARQAEKQAIDSGAVKLTYGLFDQLIRQYATRLARSAVGAGDVVGIRMVDNADHVAALFAAARVGAVILPLDWRATRIENEQVARRFRPRVVLSDDMQAVPCGFTGVDAVDVATEEPDPSSPVDLTDAPLVYALTSGTTGSKKAMVVTHEEMFERYVVFADEDMMRPGDRFLPAAPLAYAAGREFHFSLLVCGATVVKAPPMFTAAELVEVVAERQANVLLASPNITRDLLKLQSLREGRLLPGLRLYISTTGKLTPEERIAIRDRLTPNLIDFYGSTGSGPIAVIAEPADETAVTSAGHVSAGLDVEIVDDDDRIVRPGEVGWVRMRGPRITKRFAGETETDEEGPRSNGWYYPGDLGSLDRAGILHLHGRSADLIKRGGQMIHAQEVERILMLHSDVLEAAVLGLPSAHLGEEVGAFVVVANPVDAHALRFHCHKHLAPYKVPSRIEFVDALPRNSSGKVQKALLRNSRYAANEVN
jgi:acyl-coenzyme A synthetase/AMP-(fatty) acid ligase